MKEAGLPFTAPMARAVLREVEPKTQTRRLRGLEKINEDPGRWTIEQDGLIDVPGAPYTGKRGVLFRDAAGERKFVPALYEPDTLLWLREAWRVSHALDAFSGADIALRLSVAGFDLKNLPIQYEADGARRGGWLNGIHPGRYRHGRFMPRWASRVDLQYLGERVERLQDISREDAAAEGIDVDGSDFEQGGQLESAGGIPAEVWTYARLWERINGAGSWDANPWVRVVEFRRAA